MSAQLIFDIEKLEKENDTLRRQLAEERELRIMQLAAVSTASIQNTEASKKDRIDSDNPYYSTAYYDTCTAVDREMKHREALAARDEALRPFALAFDAAEEAKRRGGPATLTGTTNLTFDIEFGGEVLHRVTVHDFRSARAVLKGTV